MVERLLKVLHKEWSGLHEAAFLLAAFALGSQALALVRDRMLASRFGAGETLDVYYAAFRIPDLLYASIASFVAVTVLVPFLVAKTDEEKRDPEARRFISDVFTVFSIAMFGVMAIAWFAIPALADNVVPGFSPELVEEYVSLARLLLLSPLLFGISNLFGSVTQVFRRFFVFAAGPVLYNIGIIGGIVFLAPIAGLRGIVYGVLVGAFLHAAIQIPFLLKQGLFPRWSLRVRWPDIRRVVALSLPRTVGLSASHFVTMILVAIASTMEHGSIAVFTLAMNLQSIPLAIVGMSYSVAAFPTLSRLFSNGEIDTFLGHIATATRHIVFWSMPAMVLFIVLRAQIVRTILGAGAFDWTATKLTAAALALFAISVAAQSLVQLFVRGFYAMGDTKTPVAINLASSAMILLVAYGSLALYDAFPIVRYFIESLLRVSDIQGTRMLALPFAYSVGSIVNAVVLMRRFERTVQGFMGEMRRTFLHSFTAAVAMGFVAYHGLQLFDDVFDIDTVFGVFMHGALSGILGVLAGVFLLSLMESRELREVSASLHRKFWKSKPIAAEQENIAQ